MLDLHTVDFNAYDVVLVVSDEGERFESHAEAKQKHFDYIEVFYNQQRRLLDAGLRESGGV